jgi:hypothetical protein
MLRKTIGAIGVAEMFGKQLMYWECSEKNSRFDGDDWKTIDVTGMFGKQLV